MPSGGPRHAGAGASGTRTRQIAGGATAAAVSTAAAVFFVFMLRGNSTASFGANETYFSLCEGNCTCTYNSYASVDIAMSLGGDSSRKTTHTVNASAAIKFTTYELDNATRSVHLVFDAFQEMNSMSPSKDGGKDDPYVVRNVPDTASVVPPIPSAFKINTSRISGTKDSAMTLEDLVRMAPNLGAKGTGKLQETIMRNHPFTYTMRYGKAGDIFYPTAEQASIANAKKSLVAQLQISCPLRPGNFNYTEYDTDGGTFAASYDVKEIASQPDQLSIAKTVKYNNSKSGEVKAVGMNFIVTKAGELVSASITGSGVGEAKRLDGVESSTNDPPSTDVQVTATWTCTPSLGSAGKVNEKQSGQRRLFSLGTRTLHAAVAQFWGSSEMQVKKTDIKHEDVAHHRMHDRLIKHLKAFMEHPFRLDSAANAMLLLQNEPSLYESVVLRLWRDGFFAGKKQSLGRMVLYGVFCAAEVENSIPLMEEQLYASSKEVDNNERAQLRAELQCIRTALGDERKQAEKKRPGRKLGHQMSRPAEARKRTMQKERKQHNFRRQSVSKSQLVKDRKLATWGAPAPIDGDSVTGISPNPSMLTGSTQDVGKLSLPEDTTACRDGGNCKLESYSPDASYTGEVQTSDTIKKKYVWKSGGSQFNVKFEQSWHLRHAGRDANARWWSGDYSGGDSQLVQGSRFSLTLFGWQFNLWGFDGGVRSLKPWTDDAFGRASRPEGDNDHGVWSGVTVFNVYMMGAPGLIAGGWTPFQFNLGGQTKQQLATVDANCFDKPQHCTFKMQCPAGHKVEVCQGSGALAGTRFSHRINNWQKTPCGAREYLDMGGESALAGTGLSSIITGTLFGGSCAKDANGDFENALMCQSKCGYMTEQYGLSCRMKMDVDLFPSKIAFGFEMGTSLADLIKLALNVATGGGPFAGATIGWLVEKVLQLLNIKAEFWIGLQLELEHYHMYRQAACTNAADLRRLYQRIEGTLGITLTAEVNLAFLVAQLGVQLRVNAIEGFLSSSGTGDKYALRQYYSGIGARTGRASMTIYAALGFSIWYPCRCSWRGCNSCYWTKWLYRTNFKVFSYDGHVFAGSHHNLQDYATKIIPFEGVTQEQLVEQTPPPRVYKVYFKLRTRRNAHHMAFYIDGVKCSMGYVNGKNTILRSYKTYTFVCDVPDTEDGSGKRTLVLKSRDHRGWGWGSYLYASVKANTGSWRMLGLYNWVCWNKCGSTKRKTLSLYNVAGPDLSTRRLLAGDKSSAAMARQLDTLPDGSPVPTPGSAEDEKDAANMTALGAVNPIEIYDPALEGEERKCDDPLDCVNGTLSSDNCHCNKPEECDPKCVHGLCIDLVCRCDPGFAGADCGIDLSNDKKAATEYYASTYNNSNLTDSAIEDDVRDNMHRRMRLHNRVARVNASAETCIKGHPCGIGKLVDGDFETGYMGIGFRYFAEVVFDAPYTIASVRIGDCMGFPMTGNMRVQYWNGTSSYEGSWTTMYHGPFVDSSISAIAGAAFTKMTGNLTDPRATREIPNVYALRVDGEAFEGVYCLTEIEAKGYESDATLRWANIKNKFACPSMYSETSSCAKAEDEFREVASADVRSKLLSDLASLTGKDLAQVGHEVLTTLKAVRNISATQLTGNDGALLDHVRWMQPGQVRSFFEALNKDVILSALPTMTGRKWSKTRATEVLNALVSKGGPKLKPSELGGLLSGLTPRNLTQITVDDIKGGAVTKFLDGVQLRGIADKIQRLSSSELESVLSQINKDAFAEAASSISYKRGGWKKEGATALLKKAMDADSGFGRVSDWTGEQVRRLGPAMGYLSESDFTKLSVPSASGIHAGVVTQLLSRPTIEKLPLSPAQCAVLQPEVAARVNGKAMDLLSKDAKIALTCENKVAQRGCSCAPAVVDIVISKDNSLTMAAVDTLVLEAAKRTGQSVCVEGAVAQGCASPACLSVNAIIRSEESFSAEEDMSLAYTAVRVSAVDIAKAFEFKAAIEDATKSKGTRRLQQQVEITVIDMTKDGKAVNTAPLAVSQIFMFFGIACAAAGVTALVVYFAFSQMMANTDNNFVELNKRLPGGRPAERTAELTLSIK